MSILDVFSCLPANELGIEQIKEIFLKSCEGIVDSKYTVVHEIPENAGNNTVECKSELISEGKQVAYILHQGVIVALVGYRG